MIDKPGRSFVSPQGGGRQRGDISIFFDQSHTAHVPLTLLILSDPVHRLENPTIDPYRTSLICETGGFTSPPSHFNTLYG